MKYQSRESSIESEEDQSIKVNQISMKIDTSGQSTVVTNDERGVKRAVVNLPG